MYTCQKCSSSSYWDGYKCNNDKNKYCALGYRFDTFKQECTKVNVGVCGPNEYLQGSQCRCKPGYFFISGSCKACSYGQYFDGLKCTNIHVKQCNNSYKFWNGRSCVCLPDFFEYGSTCVRCPANTYWNGLCCKIPSPFLGPLKVIDGY